MAGGGEIPADIIIQQDYASKLARLVWNDEINDWVEPNRPPLLYYNIVLLSLWSECQQVTLLATRPLRGTGCGRVARSGEQILTRLRKTTLQQGCIARRKMFYRLAAGSIRRLEYLGRWSTCLTGGNWLSVMPPPAPRQRMRRTAAYLYSTAEGVWSAGGMIDPPI